MSSRQSKVEAIAILCVEVGVANIQNIIFNYSSKMRVVEWVVDLGFLIIKSQK